MFDSAGPVDHEHGYGRMLEQRPGDGISGLQLAGHIHETSPKRNPSLSLTPSRRVGANLLRFWTLRDPGVVLKPNVIAAARWAINVVGDIK